MLYIAILEMDKDLQVQRRRQQYLDAKAVAEVTEQHRSAVTSPNDDLLVKITERIANSLKERLRSENASKQSSQYGDAAEVGNKVEEWVTTHTCGICYEVMVPPNCTPMLLVPCGHTFCKTCMSAQASREERPRLGKCPYCRTRIEHLAENQALKSLIQLVHQQQSVSHQTSRSNVPPSPSSTSSLHSNYVEQHELCEVRHKILSDELVATRWNS